jgi:hypothetical protein
MTLSIPSLTSFTSAKPPIAGCIDVTTYGADKTGGTVTADSGPAIQAAFNAAWPARATPTSACDPTKNIPVYFPAGTYNIATTINIIGVSGALIFGDGPTASILKWTGARGSGQLDTPADIGSGSGTGTFSHLILCNGLNHSTIRDLGFDMGTSSGNRDTEGTMCFNWNWEGNPGGNPVLHEGNTHVKFFNLNFSNAGYGLICASLEPAALPPGGYPPNGGSGNQSDTVVVWNCNFNNISVGLGAYQFNAIGYSVRGGSFTNCAYGIKSKNAVEVIDGVTFSGSSGFDVQSDFPCVILRCHSTSGANGSFYNFSEMNIIGCTFATFAVNGSDATGVLSIEGCTLTSSAATMGGYGSTDVITSSPATTIVAGDPFAPPGNLTYWQQTTTFAALTAKTARNGYEAIISDGDANTTWGHVETGGGSTSKQIRWNGTAWTVVAPTTSGTTPTAGFSGKSRVK